MPKRYNLSRRLVKLWYINNFRCVKCNAEVIPVSLARKVEGWIIDIRKGLIIAPEGDVYRIATIEHITPVCKGGSNRKDNLTIYCYQCNYDSSKYLRMKNAR